MALTTMAQVIDALPGQVLRFEKAISFTSGAWHSGWASAGYPVGVTPSSGLGGDVPTNATAGALPLVNPGAGNALNVGRIHAGMAGVATGMLFLYDRLWHNSGISATAVTAQTINSAALTRPDANGEQAEAWWQVYATMGAGTPSVALTYTDQSGNTAQAGTSGVLATTMGTGRTGPFQLASGDTGVRSIQTWQADASFTSGTIGLVIRRCLGMIPITDASKEAIDDVLRSGLIAVPSGACLELIGLTNSGAAPAVGGEVQVVQG